MMSSWVTASSPFSDCRSRCVSPCDHLIKELPYIVKQEVGLFQRREVHALRHLRLLSYVVSPSIPAKRRRKSLLGKIRVRHGSLQPLKWCRFSAGEPVL